MTNLYTMPSNEKRVDEASLWIAKLDNGLSPQEQEACQQWMAADPANESTLLEMANLWDGMDSLSRLVDLFPEPAPRETPPPRGIRQAWLQPALSLSALVVIVTGLWFSDFLTIPGFSGADLSFEVYQTAVGEYSSVSLPDGSQLVINTNSRLTVDFTDEYRLINLESGEVNIRVAHDSERPFSVYAGGNIVQAIGTAFNLEINSEQQIELVVLEGKVRVAIHQVQTDGEQMIPPVTLPESALTVSAGKELLLGSSEDDIQEIKPEEIEVRLSWREGSLVFQGESLEKAIMEISRYTSVEFVFLDDDLKKVRIAGLFRAGDVDGLLETLRENFDISYYRNAEGQVLLNRQ